MQVNSLLVPFLFIPFIKCSLTFWVQRLRLSIKGKISIAEKSHSIFSSWHQCWCCDIVNDTRYLWLFPSCHHCIINIIIYSTTLYVYTRFNNPLFPKSISLLTEGLCAFDWSVSPIRATVVCEPNSRSTPVTSRVECESCSPDGAPPVDAPLRGRLADCLAVQWRAIVSLAENAN